MPSSRIGPVQFIRSAPFVAARDALIGLVRVGWDVEAAFNNWSPDQAELEDPNQEIAKRPAPESAETLQRLTTANTEVAEIRHQHAKCKGARPRR